MRVTRSVIVTSFCTLLAATAAAQGVPPPVQPASPARARTTWFERYQEARTGPETSDRWSRTFKVGPSGSLSLSNISGDITVTGGAGDEIRVEAVKRVHARDPQEAKQQLEAVTIDASERAGRVEIAANYPRTQNIHVDVDFTVQVPAGTTITARSIAGNIQLTGVKGEARLETISGNVTTSNSGQLSRVKSVSGNVSVAEAAAGDMLSLGTVSGNLVVKRLKAKALEVQTISGDLSMVDTICDRVQAKSVSGDLRYGGPLAKNGRYEFSTHSGDVRLALGSAAGFEITANSFSGELRSDLPLGGQPQAAEAPAGDDRPHGMPHRRELRGTFGDGSALVNVQTFSGDLVLTSASGDRDAGDAAKDKGRMKYKDKEKDKEKAKDKGKPQD